MKRLSDLIQIKIQADIDDGSMSQMKQKIADLGKTEKVKPEVDGKPAQKELSKIEADIKKLHTTAGVKGKKLEVFNERDLEASGAKLHKITGDVESSVKKIQSSFDSLSSTDSTDIIGKKWNENTEELEQFSVKVKDVDGSIQTMTYTMAKLDDGTSAWVRTAITGSERQIAALKEQEAAASKLMTIQKQINSLEKKAGGLDKKSDEYKRTTEEVARLRDTHKQYSDDLTKVKDTDLTHLQNEVRKVTLATEEALEKQRAMKKVTTQELGQQAQQAGRGIMALAAPIVAVGGAAVKASIDYESAFAGVRKTTEATEEQFQALSDGFRELSTRLPQSAAEIAGIGEVAGQLGIAQEDILEFTEVMVMLGDSTNMASDVAADALARFANITKMSHGDFERLGSSIVDLGNNFATTETEIVQMGVRLAGAGQEIGLSEADIMGLSTALSSVGIKAQMGGTAFSRVMVDMGAAATLGTDGVQKLEAATGKTRRELELMSTNSPKDFRAVADSIGMTTVEAKKIIQAGRDLEKFGKISGVTGAEFQQAFKEDAMGAIAMFVEGLGNAEEHGETAIELLNDMGITGTRLRDVLLRSGSAQELFNDAIETSNTAWEENTALQEEAEERYKTNESQLLILKNRVMEAGIELGGTLAPALVEVVDGAVRFVEAFGEIPVELQAAIVKGGVFMMVFGGMLSLFGRLVRGGGEMFKFFGTMKGLITGTTTLTGTLGGVATKTMGLLSGISGSSVLLAAGGIAAVALVAKGVYDHVKKVEETKAELDEMARNIPEIVVAHQKDIDNLEGMRSEFERLNPLVGANGDLSRMTADEQKKYLDIVGKLKDMFPQLETFYNDQGQLIADTGTEIEKLIKLKQEEMRLDKEKAAEGFDNQLKDSKKLAKQLEKNRKAAQKEKDETQKRKDAGGKWVTKAGGGRFWSADDEKAIAKFDKQIAEAQKRIDGATKGVAGNIEAMMGVITPSLELVGMDFEAVDKHIDGFSQSINNMLQGDSSEKGFDNATKALEKITEYSEMMQKVSDGELTFDSQAVHTYAQELRDLGMNYNDVSRSIYGAAFEVEATESSFKNMNDLIAANGDVTEELGDKIRAEYGDVKGSIEEIDGALISNIGKTDQLAAAYLSSFVEMEEGIDHFANFTKEQLKGIGTVELMTPESVEEQVHLAQQASNRSLETIEQDRIRHLEIARVKNEELGIMSDAELVEEQRRIHELSDIRREQTERELERQEEAIFKHGEAARAGVTEAINRVREDAKAFDDVWAGMGEEEKKLLIDSSEIDTSKKGWEQLMIEWMTTDPEAKKLEVLTDGFEYAKANIDELGGDWESMNSEEKILLATAIGKGLDEFEDFDIIWKGMSDDERRYSMLVEHEGFEDTKEFKQEWDKMSDEEKQLLINVTTSGVDDVDQFQKDWNSLSEETKRFIAEAVGIEDVKNANEQTMNEWAVDPLVKDFIAMHGGLDKVRVEKTETDGVWQITIGDKTYRANGEGIKEVKKDAKETTTFWNNLKPKVVTYTTRKVTEFFNKITGKAPTEKWTGDKNYAGGLSYVGERGRELLVYPNGNVDMTGSTTELRNLPRGTRIYNNRDTEAIMRGEKVPKFAKGNTKAEVNKLGKTPPGFAKGNTKAEDRAVADRYERLNRQLELQNNLLAQNNLLQDGALEHSTRKVNLMKAEIALEKTHARMLQQKQAEQRKEMRELERHLSKAGFRFKGKGDNREITNLGRVKGQNKSVEEKFDKYNDLRYNLIPGIAADVMAVNNKIADSISKGYTQQMRINDNLTKNNHLLSMNAIYLERAKNNEKETLKLLKEKERLLEREAYLTRGNAKLARTERDELEASLQRQGFKFAGRGDGRYVLNPGAAKGQVQEVMDMFARFNEIQFDVIPQFLLEEQQIKDLVSQIKDSALDAQFRASDREINALQRHTDRLRGLRDSIQVTPGGGRDIQLLERIIKQEEERSTLAYDKYWDYVNQLKDHDTDSDEWYKIRDKADDYMEMSEQISRDLYQLREERLKLELMAIDEVLEAEKEKQAELKYQMDLLGDKEVEEKLRLTKLMMDSEEEYNRVLRGNVEDLERRLAKEPGNTHQWHALKGALDEYKESLRESNLELKNMKDNIEQVSKEKLEINFDASIKDLEKSLFGGKTAKDAQKAYDNRKRQQEIYITGREKELEITRLTAMVEDNKLALTKEQARILESTGKIERASLERLEKELTIQEAQLKLDNLREQKTIRQLTKRDDGTWGFEYVADEKAIQEAEKTLNEKQTDLIEWEEKRKDDIEKLDLDARLDYLSKVEELTQEVLSGELEDMNEFYEALEKMNKDFLQGVGSDGLIDDWARTITKLSPLFGDLSDSFKMYLNRALGEHVSSGGIFGGVSTLGVTSSMVAAIKDVNTAQLSSLMTPDFFGASSMRLPQTPVTGAGSGQVFNIDKLEFPNVRDAREIENSIKNLSAFATQWANRK